MKDIKFVIRILQSPTSKLIREIEMNELIEGQVNNDETIKRYLTKNINLFDENVEYFAAIIRNANNDEIVRKQFKNRDGEIVFT
jgi:hypothetical protein